MKMSAENNQPNPAAPAPAAVEPAPVPAYESKLPAVGNPFKMKKRLSYKQVITAREMLGEFINFRERLMKADESGMSQLQAAILGKSTEQDRFMLECLQHCYGVSIKDLEQHDYLTAVTAFSDAYKSSTELPKKSGGPYV
jgi:hypothetical protein